MEKLPVLTTAAGSREVSSVFADAEGFRALLADLATQDGWRRDRRVPELLAHIRSKYARLAIKWDRDPDDAVAIAFLAITQHGGHRILAAEDPWAWLTTTVSRELKAAAHAEWLMVPQTLAKHPERVEHDKPIRASWFPEIVDRLALAPTEQGAEDADWLPATLIGILTGLGWDDDIAERCVDHILERLAASIGSDTREPRNAVIDRLRRDPTPLPDHMLLRPSWLALLSALLGQPSEPGRLTRHGLIGRLLMGEDLIEILDDDDLVTRLVQAAPLPSRGSA